MMTNRKTYKRKTGSKTLIRLEAMKKKRKRGNRQVMMENNNNWIQLININNSNINSNINSNSYSNRIIIILKLITF